MSLYMYQFKYTPAAWAAFAKKPEDRRAVVDDLLRKLGGKLVCAYYTFGEWDGLVIYEAPNEITAMAAIVKIITPGHIVATKTTVLFTTDDAIKAMNMAGALEFRGIEPLPSSWPA
ncbi:MAG TPA: GYD domain-containing protein [Candidatus Acidoferrum sp.]|nr:GYD domain-containing protein [Candidatus Acidoferrum sp.]